MSQVSNKTIVGLLAVALLLTTTSTLVTVNKLSRLGETFDLITGAASSSSVGEINLTIAATTSLTNQVRTINFGSGYVNKSCNFCGMQTDGAGVDYWANGSNNTNSSAFPGLGTCCVSFSCVITGFVLENAGNLNVSLGYTCSGNCSHGTFIAGNRAPGMNGIGIKVTGNSVALQSGEDGGTDNTASCVGGGTSYRDTGYNITNASSYSLAGFSTGAGIYTSVMGNGHWLCGNQSHYSFSSDNTKDAAVVDINITIPADAIGTGVRSSFMLTFNATGEG